MRYLLPGLLITAFVLDAPGAGAQRVTCRDCDSARTATVVAREAMLASQFARMSQEIARLRTELARAETTDPSSARALRTMIESLRMSQRHLEQAMREHEELVRSREAESPAARANVLSRARAGGSGASAGYVGLTTEARYTVRELRNGQTRRVMEFPVVVTVAPGSPAFRAGLVAGDTVLSVSQVDGRRLEQELGSLLRPGETLQFRVRRGDDVRVLPVRVEPARAGAFAFGSMEVTDGPRGSTRFEATGEGREREAVAAVGGIRPAPAIGATVVRAGARGVGGTANIVIYREPTALAGARLLTLNHDLAVKLGVEHGLYVLTVGPGTPSARGGLEAGDVIVGTRDGPIRSLAQLQDLMMSNAGSLTLRIVRDREERTATIRW